MVLFSNFTQFVVLENLLILDLELSGVKGLKWTNNSHASLCSYVYVSYFLLVLFL